MNIKKYIGRSLIIIAFALFVVALMPPVTSITPIGGVNSWIRVLGGGMFDSALRVPKGFNGKTTYYTGVDSFGRICINPVDSSLWINDGTKWKRVVDSPGTSGSGGAYIGMLITGGGAVNASLYRNAGGQLNASPLYGFDDGPGVFTLSNGAGDTQVYSNATSKIVGFFINKVVYGKGAVKDTFDFSLLTTGRRLQAPDASGVIALKSDITTQNIAQCDTTGLSVVATLRSYTTTTAGTYVVCAYGNVSAISTDIIDFRVKFTDPAGGPQYLEMFNTAATGYYSRGGFLIRAGAGTVITVYDSLITGGGTISYGAGCVIQLNHT